MHILRNRLVEFLAHANVEGTGDDGDSLRIRMGATRIAARTEFASQIHFSHYEFERRNELRARIMQTLMVA